MNFKALTILIVVASLTGACGSDDASEGAEESAETPSAEAPAEAPAPEAAPAANALGVAIADVTDEQLRAALSTEGWEVASVSSSGGNMNALGHLNGTRVIVGLGRPMHPGILAAKQAAGIPVHMDGENGIYVEAQGDNELGQRILDALVAGAGPG